MNHQPTCFDSPPAAPPSIQTHVHLPLLSDSTDGHILPKHSDLRIQGCISSISGVFDIQMWVLQLSTVISVCDKRHTLQLGLISAPHRLPMTRCTPGRHAFTCTQMIKNIHGHTPGLPAPVVKAAEWRQLPGQEVHQSRSQMREKKEKILKERENKPKIVHSQSEESKRQIQSCFSARYAYFNLQFTFTQGCYLHFNFRESSGNYSRPHNYSLIHIHNTLHILCNRLALKTNQQYINIICGGQVCT